MSTTVRHFVPCGRNHSHFPLVKIGFSFFEQQQTVNMKIPGNTIERIYFRSISSRSYLVDRKNILKFIKKIQRKRKTWAQ